MKFIIILSIALSSSVAFEMPLTYNDYFHQLSDNFYNPQILETPQTYTVELDPDLNIFNTFEPSNKAKKRKLQNQRKNTQNWVLTSESPKRMNVFQKSLHLTNLVSAHINKKHDRKTYFPEFYGQYKNEKNNSKLKQTFQKRKKRVLRRKNDKSDLYDPHHLANKEKFYESQALRSQKQLFDEYNFDIRNQILQEKLNNRMNSYFDVGDYEQEQEWDPNLEENSANEKPEFDVDSIQITKDDFCSFFVKKYGVDCCESSQNLQNSQIGNFHNTPFFKIQNFIQKHDDIHPFLNQVSEQVDPMSTDFLQEKESFEALLTEVQKYEWMKQNRRPLPVEDDTHNNVNLQNYPTIPIVANVSPDVYVFPPQENIRYQNQEQPHVQNQYEDHQETDNYDYFNAYFPNQYLKNIASDKYLTELNKMINRVSNQGSDVSPKIENDFQVLNFPPAFEIHNFSKDLNQIKSKINEINSPQIIPENNQNYGKLNIDQSNPMFSQPIDNSYNNSVPDFVNNAPSIFVRPKKSFSNENNVNFAPFSQPTNQVYFNNGFSTQPQFKALNFQNYPNDMFSGQENNQDFNSPKKVLFQNFVENVKSKNNQNVPFMSNFNGMWQNPVQIQPPVNQVLQKSFDEGMNLNSQVQPQITFNEAQNQFKNFGLEGINNPSFMSNFDGQQSIPGQMPNFESFAQDNAQITPNGLKSDLMNVQSVDIPINQTPVLEDVVSANQRDQQNELKSNLINVQPDSINVQPDFIHVQNNSINIKPEPIIIQPDPINIQPDQINIQPNLINIQPDPINIQPNDTPINQLPIFANPVQKNPLIQQNVLIPNPINIQPINIPLNNQNPIKEIMTELKPEPLLSDLKPDLIQDNEKSIKNQPLLNNIQLPTQTFEINPSLPKDMTKAAESVQPLTLIETSNPNESNSIDLNKSSTELKSDKSFGSYGNDPLLILGAKPKNIEESSSSKQNPVQGQNESQNEIISVQKSNLIINSPEIQNNDQIKNILPEEKNNIEQKIENEIQPIQTQIPNLSISTPNGSESQLSPDLTSQTQSKSQLNLETPSVVGGVSNNISEQNQTVDTQNIFKNVVSSEKIEPISESNIQDVSIIDGLSSSGLLDKMDGVVENEGDDSQKNLSQDVGDNKTQEILKEQKFDI